ncbi:hypothetical protein SKAU_G00353840 [Synaphobranchus kaupii]|uniref:SCAN box domain-containing protein n=1 Tax=Synaphobranchus kaupii TaxID=118154 RepID=A0A9Q1EKX1_SYNKA|nr:hypothetical protein SKAU_G00353840 [Synaphobranchus kaupii]
MFERAAITLNWHRDAWPLMLQGMLVGKAQVALSSLSLEQSLDYDMVKVAVLRAYELVPEAYRQKFRQYRKADRQTFVEFAREKENLFDRWSVAQGTKTFEQLRDLVIMEEFRNCVPERVAIYLNEQRATQIAQGAILAGEFIITHQRVFREKSPPRHSDVTPRREIPKGSAGPSKASTPASGGKLEDLGAKRRLVCNYCKKSDNKLTGLDARISLIEVLHREFQALRHSLEFSQEQIDTLAKDNKSLQHSVNALTTQLTSITADNKAMKQTVLNLQALSMRDNLVFTGIPEQTADDPEKAVKEFMTKQLKLPTETVNNITFHRLGPKNTINNRPRPIIAKFEHYKQKQQVQRQGRQLKGTDFGLNDQYPKEIMQRRKQLFPIRKQMMQEGKKAIISVDKLDIDGQLYRDKDVTPWLF